MPKTKTKNKSARPAAVDYKKFVKLWRASDSVGEVATALGIKSNSASSIAKRLRSEGIELKRFPRRVPQPINAKELNRIGRK